MIFSNSTIFSLNIFICYYRFVVVASTDSPAARDSPFNVFPPFSLFVSFLLFYFLCLSSIILMTIGLPPLVKADSVIEFMYNK